MADLPSDPRLGPDLLWRDLRAARSLHPLPALFLDRDGVIIEEKGYLSDPAQVRLMDGIAELIRAARELGMAVVEITNQAGIARGYFGWAEFIAVEARVTELLRERQAAVDAVFACPFHADGQRPYDAADHPWRKPNPGMLFDAASRLNLDLRRSVMVGDKAMDLEAARAAGLPRGIHVRTGHGREHEQASRGLASETFTVYVVSSPAEAAHVLQAAVTRVTEPRP